MRQVAAIGSQKTIARSITTRGATYLVLVSRAVRVEDDHNESRKERPREVNATSFVLSQEMRPSVVRLWNEKRGARGDTTHGHNKRFYELVTTMNGGEEKIWMWKRARD